MILVRHEMQEVWEYGCRKFWPCADLRHPVVSRLLRRECWIQRDYRFGPSLAIPSHCLTIDRQLRVCVWSLVLMLESEDVAKFMRKRYACLFLLLHLCYTLIPRERVAI